MNESSEEPLEHGNGAEKRQEQPMVLPPSLPPFPPFLQPAGGDVVEHPDFVPFRPPRREHFMPWLALLSSQKIPYRVEFDGVEPMILVPWDYAEQAEQEFSIYEARHANWPPPEEEAIAQET